ncbi:MAG TPA: proton-conducting transporter membrane subunit [Anaerolineae bacterium]|nr:proton-conducting transporter membrane subunit [Anaerolineae bacterium]HQI83010.1 proton-conducting transporter membrane subunit [Anaerolineae bacterium]
MLIFIAGLILVPLTGGVVLLYMGQRLPSPIGRRIGMTVAAWATACAIALTFYSGQDVPFQLTWLPNAGEMTFSLAQTGLYAALATTASACLTLLMPYPSARESLNPVYRLPSTVYPASLLLLTLAAANTAFLAGHFLARYVALEIAGVCIALVPLLALGRDAGPRLTKFVYLVLRVGDTGFLIAMLILMNAAGTLDIGPSLESGATLSATRLSWVISGFVLAVWVKVGAWPFESWQQVGEQFDAASHGWTYATVMPNLGLYLLYRITPLLSHHLALRAWVLWLSLGGIVLVTVAALVKRDPRSALVYLNAAQGGLALCLAAAGLQGAIATLLVVMTPLRLLFLWGSDVIQAETPRQRRMGSALIGAGGVTLTGFNAYLVWQLAQETYVPWPVVLLLAIVVVLMGGRYLAALWTPDRFSETCQVWQPETPRQVQLLDSGLLKLAEGLRTWFEIGFLGRVVRWTPRVFVGAAEALHRIVEQQGLEGTLRGTTRGVFALSRWVQKRHTGRLRANLRWVFVVLLVIIAVLIWQGW